MLLTDAFKKLEMDIMRGDVLKTKKRIDGRDLKTVRPILSEVHVLPRTHGSALFTRGETQALWSRRSAPATTSSTSTAWKAPGKSASCCTITSLRSRSARRAAWARRAAAKSVTASSPGAPCVRCSRAAEEFPYTLRVVSEIMESNGSSSMASVCGTSLALMDAGVPLKSPVAGIAMGLIKEGKDFAVLSDILGDEDHLGDMDFKVAGTEKGITALQMDIKITGITEEIMKVALEQAHHGRIHILGEMAKSITGARAELGEHAPRIETIKIPTDKIREVIGSGGSVIREIVAESGAKIDIEDDGTVKIASAKPRVASRRRWPAFAASPPSPRSARSTRARS